MRVVLPHIDGLTDADFARFFDRPRTGGTHLRLAERTRARLEPRTRVAGGLRDRMLSMPRTPQEQLDRDVAEMESRVRPMRTTTPVERMQQDVADIRSGKWEQDRINPQDAQRAVHEWLTETASLLSDLYDTAYRDGRANFAEQHPHLVGVEDLTPDESDDPEDGDLKDAAMRNHFASLGKMANEVMNLAFAGQLLGWFQDNEHRVNLQAGQVAWAGEQHGYREAGVGHGLEIDWELDEGAEHCADCPDLAEAGPYTDDAGDNPLPTMPGSGDTACQGNCRCSLNYRQPEPVGEPGDDEDLAPEHAEEDVAKQLGIDLADFGGAEKGGLAGSAMWVQDAIANLDREVGMSFDKAGHVLGAHVGTADSVVFQRAQIKAMRGAQLSVHNHPGSQSFSPADVAFAHAMRFGELDVYSPQYTYMLRPAKGKFDAKVGKKVVDRAEVVADKLLEDVEAKAQAGFAAQLKGVYKYGQPLAWKDYWALETRDFWHRVWSQVAPEFKLDYKRVAAPGYVAKKLPEGDLAKAPWSGMPPSKIPVDMVREQGVPAPKPLGGLPPDFPKTFTEVNSWETVAGPSGSQQGFWKKSPVSGKTYYVKPQASEARAWNEAGTMRAYEAMGAEPGVDIPNVGVVKDSAGKLYVVSERMRFPVSSESTSWWKTDGAAAAGAKQDARRLWAADALLSHYDVVGLANDNLLVGTVGGKQKVVRIEGGAGMRYRAQGAVKPGWDAAAPWDEPWTMRGKPHGSALGSGQAGPVFGQIGDVEAAKLIDDLAKAMTPQKVEALRQSWVAMGMPALQAQENIDVIKARLIQAPKVVAELAGQGFVHIPNITTISKSFPAAPHAAAPKLTPYAKGAVDAVVEDNKPLYDDFIASKMGYKGGAFNYAIDHATPDHKGLPYKERAKVAFAQWLEQAKAGDWSAMPPKVKAWFQSKPELAPSAVKPSAKDKLIPPESSEAEPTLPVPKLGDQPWDEWVADLDSWFQDAQHDMAGFGPTKDALIKSVWEQASAKVHEDDLIATLSQITGMSHDELQDELGVLVGWQPALKAGAGDALWEKYVADLESGEQYAGGTLFPYGYDEFKEKVAAYEAGSLTTPGVKAWLEQNYQPDKGVAALGSWKGVAEQLLGATDEAATKNAQYLYGLWKSKPEALTADTQKWFAAHASEIEAGAAAEPAPPWTAKYGLPAAKYPTEPIEVSQLDAIYAAFQSDAAKDQALFPLLSQGGTAQDVFSFADILTKWTTNEASVVGNPGLKAWLDANLPKFLKPEQYDSVRFIVKPQLPITEKPSGYEAAKAHLEAVAPQYAAAPTAYVQADVKAAKASGNLYVKPHDGGPVVILGNSAAMTAADALQFANAVAGWQSKAPQLFAGLKRISFIGKTSYYKADQKVLVLDKTIHKPLGDNQYAFWKGVGLKVDLEHTPWTAELNALAKGEVNLVESFATYMSGDPHLVGELMLPSVKGFWKSKTGYDPAPKATPKEPLSAAANAAYESDLDAAAKSGLYAPGYAPGYYKALLQQGQTHIQAYTSTLKAAFDAGDPAYGQLATKASEDAFKAYGAGGPAPAFDVVDLNDLAAKWAKQFGSAQFGSAPFDTWYQAWKTGSDVNGITPKPGSPAALWFQSHDVPGVGWPEDLWGLPTVEAPSPFNTTGGMKVDVATQQWLEGKYPLDAIAVALVPELETAENIADHLWAAASSAQGSSYPTTSKASLLAQVKAALGEEPGAAKAETGMAGMKADAAKWAEESDPDGSKFVADHDALWKHFKATKMDYKGGGFNWAVQTLTSDLPKGTAAKARQQVALARLFKLYHTEPDKLKQMVPKVYKWLGNAIEATVESDTSAWVTTGVSAAPTAAVAKAKLEALPAGWETKPVLQQTNAWMQSSMPNSRQVYDGWKAAAGTKPQLNAWVRTLLGPAFKAEIDATAENGDAYYKIRGLAFTKSYLMAKAGMFDELARVSPQLRDYWRELLFPPPPVPLPPGLAPWASRVDGSKLTSSPSPAVRAKLVAEIERDLRGHPDKLESWRALVQGTGSWKGGSQQTYHRAGERVIKGAALTDSTLKAAAAMWNTIRDAKPAAPQLWRTLNHSGMKADKSWWDQQVGKTVDMQLAGFSDSPSGFDPGYNTRYVLLPGARAFSTLAFTGGYAGEREWITGGRFQIVKVERQGSRNIVTLKYVAPDREGPTILHEPRL